MWRGKRARKSPTSFQSGAGKPSSTATPTLLLTAAEHWCSVSPCCVTPQLPRVPQTPHVSSDSLLLLKVQANAGYFNSPSPRRRHNAASKPALAFVWFLHEGIFFNSFIF